MATGRVLNVGCGDHALPGAIGCDRDRRAAAIDVVADLDRARWPFAAASFDRVVCQDVLEHLDDIPAAMAEIHRVLRPGGTVSIRVPHFTSLDAHLDPTHRHKLSAHSFDFCLAGTPPWPGLRTDARFALRRRHVHFMKAYRWLGIAALANRWTRRWEAHFAYWFPARWVELELEKVGGG